MEEQKAYENVVEMAKLEVIEIQNPRWLGYIAPYINGFYEKTKAQLPTICYETLYAYFEQSVSLPNAPSEFWVAKKGDDIFAFAHWYKCGLPHTGVVFMDFLYSWNRMREPVQMLMDKYYEFGKKQRCTVYKGTAVNEPVFRVFRKAAARRGYELERTPLIDFIGRKK
jgi:hypothetical protein